MKTLTELVRERWAAKYGFPENGPESAVVDQLLGCLNDLLSPESLQGVGYSGRDITLSLRGCEPYNEVQLSGSLVPTESGDYSAGITQHDGNSVESRSWQV